MIRYCVRITNGVMGPYVDINSAHSVLNDWHLAYPLELCRVEEYLDDKCQSCDNIDGSCIECNPCGEEILEEEEHELMCECDDCCPPLEDHEPMCECDDCCSQDEDQAHEFMCDCVDCCPEEDEALYPF